MIAKIVGAFENYFATIIHLCIWLYLTQRGQYVWQDEPTQLCVRLISKITVNSEVPCVIVNLSNMSPTTVLI
jgi:hypothetical protein